MNHAAHHVNHAMGIVNFPTFLLSLVTMSMVEVETTQEWNMRYIVNFVWHLWANNFFASFFRRRQKTDLEIKVEPSHSSPESESVRHHPGLPYQFRFQWRFLLSPPPLGWVWTREMRETRQHYPQKEGQTNNTEEAGLHNPLTFGVARPHDGTDTRGWKQTPKFLAIWGTMYSICICSSLFWVFFQTHSESLGIKLFVWPTPRYNPSIPLSAAYNREMKRTLQIFRQPSRRSISSFWWVPPSIQFGLLWICCFQYSANSPRHATSKCQLVCCHGAKRKPCRSQSCIQTHQRLGSTSEWSSCCCRRLGRSHISRHNLRWRKRLCSSHVASTIRTESSTSPNVLLRSLDAQCVHFRSSWSPGFRSHVPNCPNMCWTLRLHRKHRSRPLSCFLVIDFVPRSGLGWHPRAGRALSALLRQGHWTCSDPQPRCRMSFKYCKHWLTVFWGARHLSALQPTAGGRPTWRQTLPGKTLVLQVLHLQWAIVVPVRYRSSSCSFSWCRESYHPASQIRTSWLESKDACD